MTAPAATAAEQSQPQPLVNDPTRDDLGRVIVKDQPPAQPATPSEPTGRLDDLGRLVTSEPYDVDAVLRERGLDVTSDVARAAREAEAELRSEWGPAYGEKCAAARFAAAELNRVTNGAAFEFLDRSGLGDHPLGIQFFAALAEALAEGSPAVPVPSDEREAAALAVRLLDDRLDGGVSEFLHRTGWSRDQRVVGLLAGVAKLLGEVETRKGNPVDVRREIERLGSDPRFLRGEMSPAEHREHLAKLQALYRLLG